MLTPYKSYKFTYISRKNGNEVLTSALITVIEMDLPILSTKTPAGYLQRKINLNEEISFDLII